MEDIYIGLDGEVISKLAFTRRVNLANKYDDLWGEVVEFIAADGNRYHIMRAY